MTPSGRISAIIELMDAILASFAQPRPRPADVVINHYFKNRRFIGSKDRGAIAELTYFILRHMGSLRWWLKQSNLPQSGRNFALAALVFSPDSKAVAPPQGRDDKENTTSATLSSLFTGGQFSPQPLSAYETKALDIFIRHCERERNNPELDRRVPGGARDDELLIHPDMPEDVAYNVPAWMLPKLKEGLGAEWKEELAALNKEAPVDIRANTLKTTREALAKSLAEDGFETAPSSLSPWGLRLNKRGAFFTANAFKQGGFEMQDAASQMVALLTDAKPGMKVIDFCAGAGGKTLALAAMMQNKGRILAWDNSEMRLKQLKLRLKRAGVDNVTLHVIASESDPFIKRHKDSADRVLVDAPCTGSGTWRRNPDLKWRSREQEFEALLALQQRLLQSAMRLVKPGGRLVYATCSLLEDENQSQIENALKLQPNFRVVSWKKIWNKGGQEVHDNKNSNACFLTTPYKDGVDGFFAAILEKNTLEKSLHASS